MTRKIKVVGLLAAVFALSALGASSAMATEKSFHHDAPSGKATIHGHQIGSHVFTTNAGTVTCKTATFHGMQETPTTMEITVEPTYSNCTAFGFVNVPIHTTGCHYTFTSATTTNGTNEPNPVTHVACSGGNLIRITAPFCTTTVGNQTILGNTFDNGLSSGKKDVTVTTNVSGITYNECGTVRTNGTYVGETTVTATDTVTGAAVNGWYE